MMYIQCLFIIITLWCIVAFPKWNNRRIWKLQLTKYHQRSHQIGGSNMYLMAIADDDGGSPWAGRINANEIFFKEELQKMELDIAKKEAQKKFEARSKLGETETTTRRIPTPQQQVQREVPLSATAAAGVGTSSFNATTSSSGNSSSGTTTTRLPFLNIDSIGLTGRWIERSGNFIIRPIPTAGATVQPRGVIHFLGGAFVGAAPHLTYRYLLESLCDAGYVVVATPYRLDFDYVRSCDSILTKFDAVAFELAQEYGPVPVIGLGHSCGALLQVLITSLFPDAPRAANVLISFNNRPANAAIPGLQDIIGPLSEMIMHEGEQGTSIRAAIRGLRGAIERSIQSYSESAIAPAFVGKDLIPVLQQGVEIVDQIPPLLSEIAAGVREFQPSPVDTKEVCRRMYRARRTLLLKFESDELDESTSIEKVLREANTIMRMRRPMIEMEVELKILSGTHITPLTQNIVLEPPEGIPDLLEPLRSRVRDNFLLTVDQVKDSVLDFLAPLSNIKSV